MNMLQRQHFKVEQVYYNMFSVWYLVFLFKAIHYEAFEMEYLDIFSILEQCDWTDSFPK